MHLVFNEQNDGDIKMTETVARVIQQDTAGLTLTPENQPNVDDLITEDDTPVDNPSTGSGHRFASEKQQRLLTEPLYSSWAGPDGDRTFLVAANVGLFPSVHEPPLVPDVFLSLDVTVPEDWWAKRQRTYFFWEFGKPPEVVIEIVSNREGGEKDTKLEDYARMRVLYYVIYDPLEQVQDGVLRVYELTPRGAYVETSPALLAGVELGLTLWQGEFENREDAWLRWQDADGNLILTGAERAEQAEQRAEEAEQRAQRLMAQLRALGVEPEES